MTDDILKSKRASQFLGYCKAFSELIKKRKQIPSSFISHYHKSLFEYRKYLDDIGLKMIKPKYDHYKEHPEDWIYKTCILVREGDEEKLTWKLNEDCHYYARYCKDNGIL